MARKIVVLDDGETWSGAASVLTVTDEWHERLMRGECSIQDIVDGGVLECQEVDTGD